MLIDPAKLVRDRAARWEALDSLRLPSGKSKTGASVVSPVTLKSVLRFVESKEGTNGKEWHPLPLIAQILGLNSTKTLERAIYSLRMMGLLIVRDTMRNGKRVIEKSIHWQQVFRDEPIFQTGGREFCTRCRAIEQTDDSDNYDRGFGQIVGTGSDNYSPFNRTNCRNPTICSIINKTSIQTSTEPGEWMGDFGSEKSEGGSDEGDYDLAAVCDTAGHAGEALRDTRLVHSVSGADCDSRRPSLDQGNAGDGICREPLLGRAPEGDSVRPGSLEDRGTKMGGDSGEGAGDRGIAGLHQGRRPDPVQHSGQRVWMARSGPLGVEDRQYPAGGAHLRDRPAGTMGRSNAHRRATDCIDQPSTINHQPPASPMASRVIHPGERDLITRLVSLGVSAAQVTVRHSFRAGYSIEQITGILDWYEGHGLADPSNPGQKVFPYAPGQLVRRLQDPYGIVDRAGQTLDPALGNWAGGKYGVWTSLKAQAVAAEKLGQPVAVPPKPAALVALESSSPSAMVGEESKAELDQQIDALSHVEALELLEPGSIVRTVAQRKWLPGSPMPGLVRTALRKRLVAPDSRQKATDSQ